MKIFIREIWRHEICLQEYTTYYAVKWFFHPIWDSLKQNTPNRACLQLLRVSQHTPTYHHRAPKRTVELDQSLQAHTAHALKKSIGAAFMCDTLTSSISVSLTDNNSTFQHNMAIGFDIVVTNFELKISNTYQAIIFYVKSIFCYFSYKIEYNSRIVSNLLVLISIA